MSHSKNDVSSQHELSGGSSCQLTGAICNITNNRTASSMKIVSEKDDIPGYPETGGINCSGSPQVSTQLQNTNWSVKNNEISDISLKNISAGDPITERICLIGLHCCGDLTPTMLKLFTQSIELKALIVLGCCYHRMTTTTAGILSGLLSSMFKINIILSKSTYVDVHPEVHFSLLKLFYFK